MIIPQCENSINLCNLRAIKKSLVENSEIYLTKYKRLLEQIQKLKHCLKHTMNECGKTQIIVPVENNGDVDGITIELHMDESDKEFLIVKLI